jgi:hypothetical protein
MRTINSRSTPRTYPARHPARARGMRRKQKQGERRRKGSASGVGHDRRGSRGRFVDRQRRAGQPDSEARALAFLALHFDGPVMQIHRSLDQMEPGASADDTRDVAAAVVALE